MFSNPNRTDRIVRRAQSGIGPLPAFGSDYDILYGGAIQKRDCETYLCTVTSLGTPVRLAVTHGNVKKRVA